MEHGDGAKDRVGDLVAGRYRLTRLLGAGGMGAVYAATHEFTQRTVAVKLMHPSFARSTQAAERFVREARAPGSIGHPGIIEVLDGGRAEDGSLYLVLELLEGETLAARMRGQRMSPAALSTIAIALLDALEAAHQAGFVHRDIKPENIFLVATGDGAPPRVTLLDFGIASVLDVAADSPGLTQAGAVLGTPLYMSPEQALGRRVDGRSDLWSVGALCYQALTGQPPFIGASAQALIVSIATEEHLPLSVASPDLPLRVVKVVERALHKQADKRWQSASEMAEALRVAMAGGQQRARDSDAETLVAEAKTVAVQKPVRAAVARPAPAALPVELPATPRSSAAVWLGMSAGVAALAAAFVLFVREPTAESAARATGALVAAPVAKRKAREAQAVQPAHVPEKAQEREPEVGSGVGVGVGVGVGNGVGVGSGTEAAAVVLTPTPAPPAPAPPPPSRVPNTIDNQALSAVLHDHQQELQRCYEDVVVAALLKQDTQAPADPAPVRLDAELLISPGGDVREVALRGDATDAMRDCARNAIRAWRFPAASSPTSLRIPLVFQPNIVRQ